MPLKLSLNGYKADILVIPVRSLEFTHPSKDKLIFAFALIFEFGINIFVSGIFILSSSIISLNKGIFMFSVNSGLNMILLMCAMLFLFVFMLSLSNVSIFLSFTALNLSICIFSLCVILSACPLILASKDNRPLFIPKSFVNKSFNSTLSIKSCKSIFLSIFPFNIKGALFTYPVAFVMLIELFEKSTSEFIFFIFKLLALIEPLEILKNPVDFILCKSPFRTKSADKSPSIESMPLNFDKSRNGFIFL